MKQYIKDYLIAKCTSNDNAIEKYIQYIESCIDSNISTQCDVERHHIVPKSWNKLWCKNNDNIVALTVQQHIIAHGLLALTKDPQMLQSLWGMIVTRQTDIDIDSKIKWLDEQFHLLNVDITVNDLLIERNVNHSKHMSKKMLDVKGRKVINLNTGKTYNSVTEACIAHKIESSNLVKSCKDGIKAGGYYWMYVDELKSDIDYKIYLAQRQEQSIMNRKRPNRHIIPGVGGEGSSNYKAAPIINIDTGEILQYARLLDIRTNHKPNYTLYAINRFTKIEGSLWTYYDKTKTLQQHRQDTLINESKYRKHSMTSNRKVICLTTNQIYDDIKQASCQTGISKSKIKNSCLAYCKTENNTSWRFLDELNNPYVIKHSHQ